MLPDSPCIDTRSNDAVPKSVHIDLDGNPHMMSNTVDMGVYEFREPMNLYIDVFNSDEDNNGSNCWLANYRPPSPGTYVLIAKATDDDGAKTISPSVEIMV